MDVTQINESRNMVKKMTGVTVPGMWFHFFIVFIILSSSETCVSLILAISVFRFLLLLWFNEIFIFPLPNFF